LSEVKDIKMLVICILVADILGGVVYGTKGNIVGLFNCVSWSVIAAFVLFNFKNIFK